MSDSPIFPVLREQVKAATILPLLDCNSRCPFCSTRVYTDDGVLSPVDFRNDVRRRAKDYTLSLAELRDAYDRLRADGVEVVSLQGGEPTLHEGLVELISYGWKIGFTQQTVVSNGRRFKDRAFAEALLAAKPTTIVLSIFGGRAQTHDESMGVPNAFADLLAGVRHLRELRAPERGTSLMAQLTVHARNFRELPETVRFWYAAGLRDFSIRLLRETENTGRESGRWFFDLADLRAPLDEVIDFSRAHRDVFLNFSELPYCIASPRQLGRVLLDLGSNPNLGFDKLQYSKHFERPIGAREEAPHAATACDSCEVRGACLRLEAQYAPHFSGRLEPIAVQTRVAALLAGGVDASNVELARDLVQAESRLGWFGVTVADRQRLRGALVRWVAANEPSRLADELLGERGCRELEDRLRKSGHRPVRTRHLAVSSFGGAGPLSGEPKETLARLTASSAPENIPRLEFLAKLQPVADTPLVLLFAYARRTAAREELVFASVFDDSEVDERVVDKAIAQALAR